MVKMLKNEFNEDFEDLELYKTLKQHNTVTDNIINSINSLLESY